MSSKLYGETRTKTQVPPITLIQRPEQAHFHLQAEVQTETALLAVPILERATHRLEQLLPPLGATCVVTRFELPHESGKLSNAPSRLHVRVILPFAPDASVWDRAHKLAQLDDLLRMLVLEGKKQKPALELRRDLPVFVVADPEAFRATLVKRLHERARSLGAGEPVHLKELSFDHAVTQVSLGLEEVALSLVVDGTAECVLK